MSSGKTPKLGMHKWVPNDYVQMNEFNENFQKIDDNAAEVTASLVNKAEQSEVTIIKNVVVSIEEFPIQSGETDYTGSLARATDYVFSNGGGRIEFPSGIFIAKYYVPKTGVKLRGSGMNSTILKLANNQNNHFIRFNETILYSGITDMTIDGNKANNTSGDVVHIESTAHVTSHLEFTNLEITNGAANNIFISRYNYGITMFNIKTSYARAYGFFNQSSDNTFILIYGFSNGRAAIYENGLNNRWIGGKHFYNNQDTAYQNEGAVMIASSKRSSFEGIETQENRGHGFVVSLSENITLGVILADCNGVTNENASTASPLDKDGLQIRATSKNITVVGYTADDFRRNGGNGAYKPAQNRGLWISSDCTNITVVMSEQNQNLASSIETISADVTINGKKFKEIKTMLRSRVSQALNLPAATHTLVTFQSTDYDTLNEIINGVFTPVFSGIYLINTGLFFPSQTDGNAVQLNVYRNGSEARRIASNYAKGTGTHYIGGSTQLRLDAGDIVDLRCFVQNACTIDANGTRSYLEIMKVGSN